MFGIRVPKPVTVTAPCPRVDVHRPHFHPGGQAKCPGIDHDCATMGHVWIALAGAFGCVRCGREEAYS